MDQFLNNLNWFICGAAFGYFFYPLCNIIKKIIHEAKLAQKEWRNPPEK